MTQEQQTDDTFAIRNRIDENWRRRTPQRIAALKAGEPTPPATPQPETPDRIEVIAREIAKVLMTNSLGERCDRLAQLLQGFPLGCGWSLDGATAMIRETLEQEGYILDRMAEATRRAQLAFAPPPDVERLTRPETGPMQFGDDWPGVFVRGDNASGIVATLMSVVALVEQTRPMEAVQLRSIMRLFDSSDVRKKPEVQRAVLLSSTPGEPR